MHNLFPVIMAVLELGAAIVDFYNGSIARALYWIFGAGITITVIFLK
jgi:hypothetical protein